MTVIVGALTRGYVTLAADGMVSEGRQKAFGASPKLWVDRGYAFGYAGGLRAAQVARYHVDWPIYRGPAEDGDFEGFLVSKAIPALRAGMEGHGVIVGGESGESTGTGFIIATGNVLAEISNDFGVFVSLCGRLAIGSAWSEAMGSLGNEGPWTERKLVDAVRRAAITDKGVGGDISVINTRTLKVRAA